MCDAQSVSPVGFKRHRATAVGVSAVLLTGSIGGVAASASSQLTPTTFDFTGAIEAFEIPPGVTSVTIDALGAGGGDASPRRGGAGRRMIGTFSVAPGDILHVLVGQRGADGDGFTGAGGGGGSFVSVGATLAGSTLLIAAGGGGGASNSRNGRHGSGHTYGMNGDLQPSGDADLAQFVGGVGGEDGSGGEGGTGSAEENGNGGGGGGGGFLEAGSNGTGPVSGSGGSSVLSGGAGGGPSGGFGGGGGGGTPNPGGSQSGPGGGGGGYSGGGGGQGRPGANRGAGGGGGSFNAGTDQINVAGQNTDHGRVSIR